MGGVIYISLPINVQCNSVLELVVAFLQERICSLGAFFSCESANPFKAKEGS